jgi:UDP-N-acetylglucosamine--N-acetylmuramyl-(pentapeptide) pyrophosphoryl-undecaprenol N-acetylglucosamine transferase
MQHKEGKQKTAIIMAGGTGGHIFPGIALAEELRNKGWKVCWMGAPNSMEERLVIPKGFEFKKVEFGGVRGKGIKTLINLPFKILRALSQSRKIIKEVNPDVVIGFGGYITFPGGLMTRLNGKPLILHEQNSIAGLSNKVLSKIATKVFTAYPYVFPKGEWIGNPLRAEFLEQDNPENRFKGREGPLNVVVVGGSLGAKAINDIMPKALALIDENLRPNVIHQSGEKQIEELKKAYEENGVKAELTPFISNTAQAFANADLIIARAGASTVTEIAAIGAAAIFIPFPHAVDDHQTFNAKFLENAGAGLIIQQKELETKWLADILIYLKRDRLLEYANKAYELRKIEAVKCMVESCEKLVK